MAKRQGKSPIRWFGGKYRMAPHIVDLFPTHRIYVEAFGGGGSVLFAKPPSIIEVYNDLDEGATNFFNVVRDETACAILAKRLAATPYSRADYYRYLPSWHAETDPIEKARQWFVLARMSFGAMFGNAWAFGRSGEKRCMATSSWLGAQRLMLEAQERLALVQIENRDFRKVIELYDTPETLFYLDPPYVPDTRKEGGYRHELTDEDHRDLVELMLTMKGQAILSGYRSELYAPLEDAGFVRVEREVYCTARGNTRQDKNRTLKGSERTECIWHRPVGATQLT